MSDLKICSKCQAALPLTEFHKQISTRDGYRTVCKSCRSEAGSPERKARNAAYIANPETQERQRASSLRWKKKNPEKRLEYNRRWREQHRQEARDYSRKYYEKHRDEILEKQRVRRAKNKSEDGNMSDIDTDKFVDVGALYTAVTTGHFPDHTMSSAEAIEIAEKTEPVAFIKRKCIDNRCPATRFASDNGVREAFSRHRQNLIEIERGASSSVQHLDARVKELEERIEQQENRKWWK